MGLLSDVVLLPVTGPVRGFRAILEAIRAEVEAEMLDEGRVQGALMELELRHNAGQIDDAEFEAEESRLLEQLNQMRLYREQSTGAPSDPGGSGP